MTTTDYDAKEWVGADNWLVQALAAAHAERDALAARLATLAAAGIVVGEDGAVRWHGLTGAEIEGAKERAVGIAQAAMMALRITAWESNEDDDSPKLFCRGCARYRDEPHEEWCSVKALKDLCASALAAAARRGADGEATE